MSVWCGRSGPLSIDSIHGSPVSHEEVAEVAEEEEEQARETHGVDEKNRPTASNAGPGWQITWNAVMSL